jgi:hypothetical protein
MYNNDDSLMTFVPQMIIDNDQVLHSVNNNAPLNYYTTTRRETGPCCRVTAPMPARFAEAENVVTPHQYGSDVMHITITIDKQTVMVVAGVVLLLLIMTR